LFKNKITEENIFGKLLKIEFYEDISEPIQYFIINMQSGKTEILNSSLFSKRILSPNEIYFFKNDFPMILKEIKFNEDQKDGYFLFMDEKNNKIIKKPIKKTKLPLSTGYIDNLENKILFLKLRGQINIFKCVKIKPSNKFEEYELELIDLSYDESKKKMDLKIDDLLIRPRYINLSISKKPEYRKSELKVLNWLLNSKTKCTVWLKKPVNNYEIGYIQKVNVRYEKTDLSIENQQLAKKDNIIFKNIFGKVLDVPYKMIEQFSFEYDGAMIQKKTNTSIISRLAYRVLKKYYPQKIIMT
jgi:hypothetical protein